MIHRRKSKQWLQERKQDRYFLMAKRNNYRSRSAYKLLEIINKFHIMKKGDYVLDLGAAPGGWTQVARKSVGEKGIIVALDTKKISPFKSDNIKIITADINTNKAAKSISSVCQRKFDVILSDISPSIMGVWEIDLSKQVAFFSRIIELVEEMLKPQGNLLVKQFYGDELKKVIISIQTKFNKIRIVKPQASKPRSREVYILAMGFKILE